MKHSRSWWQKQGRFARVSGIREVGSQKDARDVVNQSKKGDWNTEDVPRAENGWNRQTDEKSKKE